MIEFGQPSTEVVASFARWWSVLIELPGGCSPTGRAVSCDTPDAG